MSLADCLRESKGINRYFYLSFKTSGGDVDMYDLWKDVFAIGGFAKLREYLSVILVRF